MGKKFSWSLYGNLIFIISQFFLISFLSHQNQLAIVGEYGLALAITAPLIKLCNLQLNAVLASDQKKEIKLSSLFIIRCTFLVFVFLLIIILCIIVKFYDESLSFIIFLVGLFKIIESFSDLAYGSFQREEKIKMISLSKIYRGLSFIILFTFTYTFFENIYISLFSISLGWLLIFLGFDLKNQNLTKPDLKNNWIFYRKIILIGIPLGLSGTIDLINVNIPRYYTKLFLTSEDVGYYTTVSYLMIVGGVLIDSISVSLIPRLSSLYIKNEIKKFHALKMKINLLTLFIGLIGIIISIITGKWILLLLFGIDNHEAYILLIEIMVGCLFWYYASIYNVYLFSIQKYDNLLKIILITMILTVVFGGLLIYKYNILGAGLTFIVCMSTRFILTFINYKNFEKTILIKGEAEKVNDDKENYIS